MVFLLFASYYLRLVFQTDVNIYFLLARTSAIPEYSFSVRFSFSFFFFSFAIRCAFQSFLWAFFFVLLMFMTYMSTVMCRSAFFRRSMQCVAGLIFVVLDLFIFDTNVVLKY